MNSPADKRYLGDAVYATFKVNLHQIVLTVEDGTELPAFQTIFLDETVFTALVAYAKLNGFLRKVESP